MSGFLRNILWPTDFSREASEALHYADLFAQTFSSAVMAVHVSPDFMPGMYQNSLPVQRELLRRQAELKKEAMEKIRALEKKRSMEFSRVIVTEGSPAKKIIEVAKKEKADLIVMGKHGQSVLEKLIIGSVANHVLRNSPVPVLVTKKGKRIETIRKILVPTDFTKGEETEREIAWKIARGFKASFTFLYVLELFGHEFRLVGEMVKVVEEKFKKTLEQKRSGVEVSVDIIKAISAAQGIKEYARKKRSDLIVMATCVGKLSRLFLGSTTEKVIAATDLPVFAIPPKYCS